MSHPDDIFQGRVCIFQHDLMLNQTYNNITSFPFPKVQQLASSVHRWLQTATKFKDGPFLWCVSPIKAFSFFLNFRMVLLSTFKHLICFLCYIMNKWWVNEIWKWLHSVAFFILRCIPAFLELGLYFSLGVAIKC